MTADYSHLSIDDISAVNQDYLKTIWSFSELQPVAVKTSLLANKMGVSASTASEAVKRLADQGLVYHKRYGTIMLTDTGTHLALLMVRRHRIIETFLVTFLDYTWDEIHDEAERLEHAISDTFLLALERKLGFPAFDPHGDPIPDSAGNMPVRKLIQLNNLDPQQKATITRINDFDPDFLRYCESIGLILGTVITVHQHVHYAGIIELSMQDGTILTLGNQAAESIWVHKEA